VDEAQTPKPDTSRNNAASRNIVVPALQIRIVQETVVIRALLGMQLAFCQSNDSNLRQLDKKDLLKNFGGPAPTLLN